MNKLRLGEEGLDLNYKALEVFFNYYSMFNAETQKIKRISMLFHRFFKLVPMVNTKVNSYYV